MPQLMQKIKNERGSILVATIAFAIIMAIAGSGLMMLAGNSVNNEQAALENDQAFLAAESGLQIGLRWLAVTTNWDDNHTGGLINFHTCGIGNMTVFLSLVMDNGQLVLKSQASRPEMDYFKEVSCIVEQDTAPARVFFNTLDGNNGLDNIWFDGPFHSNAPLLLAASSVTGNKRGRVCFTSGPVTVNNTGGVQRNYGSGPSGNNYNFGIQVEGLSEDGNQGDDIDAYFDNTFTHSQDALLMPQGLTRNPDIVLPSNNSGRAVLFFDTTAGSNSIGRARYYYHDAADNLVIVPIPNIDGRIIRAQNPICVLGDVKGKATVVTDNDCDIIPVSDLTYAGQDRNILVEDVEYQNERNYGVSFDNPNFLALVSGGNIRFEDGQEQNINTSTGTLSDKPDIPNDFRTIYLSAALIAANPNKGITWETRQDGTLNMDDYRYNIRAVGSRTVNTFFNYAQKSGGATANDRFRFFFDRRLLNNLSAPGLPSIQRVTATGVNLYLLKTVWREKNILK